MNISSKDLLLYHLDHTYEHDAMSHSLSSTARGLTPDQAAWKPSPARHSIWQIVRHVAHWKEATLSALDGRPVEYDAWNKSDWQEVSGSQRDWDSDVEHLQRVSLPSVKDGKGHTAVDLAHREGGAEVVTLLEQTRGGGT